MPDATFGVKVPEELKDQLSKLMQDNGLSGKDFMQTLLNSYLVERTKEKTPEAAQELKELQLLTQRINNIYLNLGYRIDTMIRSKDEETGEQLRKKDDIISSLQSKTAELEVKVEMITEAFNTSVNQKNELNQRVNELTDSNNNVKALVEEYKSKNDTLTGLVNEYKAAKEENEDLKDRLNQSNLLNIQVNNEKIAKGKEIEQLQENIKNLSLTVESLKEQHKSEKEELKVQHKDDLEHLIEQHKTDLERTVQDITRTKNAESREEILKLKEEQQEKIQTIQNQYQDKISEYQDKYRALLEEHEKFRTLLEEHEKNNRSTKK